MTLEIQTPDNSNDKQTRKGVIFVTPTKEIFIENLTVTETFESDGNLVSLLRNAIDKTKE